MPTPLVDEYARVLQGLEGLDFQAEVNARMTTVIVGFQTIPTTPRGDAGLDGLSHNGTHAYCCYGMTHNSFQDNRSREKAVVKKFSADLRRLFELETQAQAQALVHKATPELPTILAANQRLLHINLVSNWFQSHRVIGPLMTRFHDYKTASSCRYVSPTATLIIMGPAELANRYAVDEVTIARATARGFVDRVRKVAKEHDIVDPIGFDVKLDILRQLLPDHLSSVDGVAKGLRANWRTALAFERELGDTVPDLHRALEYARSQILTNVSELMISEPHPWRVLLRAEELARDILAADFGELYGTILPQVSSGEIARLIGECPVGWRRTREEQ